MSWGRACTVLHPQACRYMGRLLHSPREAGYWPPARPSHTQAWGKLHADAWGFFGDTRHRRDMECKPDRQVLCLAPGVPWFPSAWS